MCGICGTIGSPNKDLLKKMADALIHRGPDSEGFYLDETAGLGIRRLRIIDLETGDQPVYNEDKTLCLIINGEIYNFKELRSGLQSRGHKFYTRSDTEVIVHLYEDYGKDCVNKLEGMFAFAIWDKKKQELFIARDRLGIKPLYYYYNNGIFRFASEMKSILADKSLSFKINPQALAYFFSFLYIPCPLSIFQGIYKLPPAHTLSLKGGQLRIEKYWDLTFKNKLAGLSVAEYAQTGLKFLEDSVGKHLISDVPLGVFLSGGIDSSAITALMRKITGGSIKTFSIGFGEKDKSYNELDYARIVSDKFGTEHRQFIIEPKIIDILPEVVWHLDEPFADSSAILNFLIAREARRHVTVALTGIGGDEVFGGYPRYLGARMSLAYTKLPLRLRKFINISLSPFLRETLSSGNTAGRIKRFLKGCLLDDCQRYIYWLRFFEKAEGFSLFSGELKEELLNADIAKIHTDYFNGANADDYLDKIYYVDANTYLPDDLLHIGDRMSMAHSLEVRVPFCDHKLAEFCAAVPYQVKFNGFNLKGLLKKSLRGILPESILNKRKSGFMAPVGRWLKDDLKDYVVSVLSEEAIERTKLFNYKTVRIILDDHFQGRANHTHQIWALLVFKLWYDSYIDNHG